MVCGRTWATADYRCHSLIFSYGSFSANFFGRFASDTIQLLNAEPEMIEIKRQGR